MFGCKNCKWQRLKQEFISLSIKETKAAGPWLVWAPPSPGPGTLLPAVLASLFGSLGPPKVPPAPAMTAGLHSAGRRKGTRALPGNTPGHNSGNHTSAQLQPGRTDKLQERRWCRLHSSAGASCPGLQAEVSEIQFASHRFYNTRTLGEEGRPGTRLSFQRARPAETSEVRSLMKQESEDWARPAVFEALVMVKDTKSHRQTVRLVPRDLRGGLAPGRVGQLSSSAR